MEGQEQGRPAQPIPEKTDIVDRRADVPDLIPFLKPGERVVNVDT